MSLHDQLPLRNRRQAGELLAAELDLLRDEPDLLVLGLPHGGMPVAWEVARALHAPMDAFVVRKISMPQHPEFVIGAIAQGGVQVLDPVPARVARPIDVEAAIERETEELLRRQQLLRPDMPPLTLRGRSVLLVDDGMATGATMEAAVRAARALQPRQLAVAAPVGSAAAVARLRPLVDLLVIGATPEPFGTVAVWYRDFPRCSDEEVQALLAQARHAEAV